MADDKKQTGGGKERGSGSGDESHYVTIVRGGSLTEVVRRPGPAPAKGKEPTPQTSNDPEKPNRTN